MASKKEQNPPGPEDHERLISERSSLGTTDNIQPTDTKATGSNSSKHSKPSGAFHQYERVDQDEQDPASEHSSRGAPDPGVTPPTSSSLNSNRRANRGHSDADTTALLAGSENSGRGYGPRETPSSAGSDRDARGVALDSADVYRSRQANAMENSGSSAPPLRPSDPEGSGGYTLRDHNCQIRPADRASASSCGDSQGTKEAPKVMVIRPSRAATGLPAKGTPPPGSTQQLTSSSSSAAESSADAGPNSGGVKPKPRNPAAALVITKQPSSQKLVASGAIPLKNENDKSDNGDSSSKKTASNGDKKKKDDEKSDKKKKKKGGEDNDDSAAASKPPVKPMVNNVPQTNFLIGLLVTCCFNPPLGVIAMVISLRAAAAYRDGDPKTGASRARTSIIISLISIMLTMLVVSTVIVYTAVDKHGSGGKKNAGKKASPFGF